MRRRSIRLPGHDYSRPGGYFVTLAAYARESLFGAVVDGCVALNQFGQIAAEAWVWLEHQYPYVKCDAWVLMPNHLHAIV